MTLLAFGLGTGRKIGITIMGLIRRAASFTRFMVAGKPPLDYAETFPQRIIRHGFRNLDEISSEERSQGWVNIMDMFDSQFRGQEFFKDHYVSMSWRVDVRRVPSKALKLYCMEEENKTKEMEKRQFLSKDRQREIRNRVKSQLLKRAIPLSNTYDMVWNLDTGEVYFASVSNKICGEFAEYFRKTFDLGLEALFPYNIALKNSGKSDVKPGQLDSLQPCRFTEEVSGGRS